jgi:hypothetical protein
MEFFMHFLIIIFGGFFSKKCKLLLKDIYKCDIRVQCPKLGKKWSRKKRSRWAKKLPSGKKKREKND